MSYKTILAHVDQARNMPLRIDLVIKLAQAQQAHVVGIAPVGVSRHFFQNAAANKPNSVFSDYLTDLHARANETAKIFEEALHRKKLASCEVHAVMDDAFGSIEQHLRYCDLVVLGQYDAEHSIHPMDATLVEEVLLGGCGPALIVPHNPRNADLDRNVLIAWNGSIQARRAVRDALPLLKNAATVQVAIFTPDAVTDNLDQQLLPFLQRHGIQASIVAREASGRDAGDVLLSTLEELDSDLLVMGCYGQSRFHETLLGGVTRTILRSMPVPVLMSH